MSTGLRERKKHETRQGMIEAAVSLFEAHGFDAVTVDQIAAAAGVSSRTFFRYFPSKEAVLFADQDEMLEVLERSIAEQPVGVPAFDVLEEAVIALARYDVEHLELRLRRARLAETGAATAAYQRSVLQPLWEDAIARALARHLGVAGDEDLRPRMLAGVGIAVMGAVGHRWVSSGGRDAEGLVRAAFSELRESVNEPS